MVFRRLVANWLRTVAAQRIRREAVETARQKLAEAAETAQREEPKTRERPCDVAVVFALGIEAGGLEDLLAGVVQIRGHGFVVWQGGLKGRHVVIARSGPGQNAARHATEALISGHRPQWIISAGFAGGLSGELKRHDVVMADSVAGTSGKRLAIDLKVDPQSLAQTPGVHVGRLITVDRVVRLPQEKRDLGQQQQSIAVDMESFAVAEVCRRHAVRFLAVRVITDAVDEELPPDVQRLLAQKTRAAKLGAVIGAVWNRPSSVGDMLRLKEDAFVASDRLAKFLSSMIEQLVPLAPARRD